MAWTGYTGGAKEDNRTSALGNTKKVTAADMNAISEALTDHEDRIETLEEIVDVTTGITAYAGGGQANATSLTSKWNFVTTCATRGDSVKVPAALQGVHMLVINQGAQMCSVYPQTGENFNGKAANAAISLPVNTYMEVFCETDGVWQYRPIISVYTVSTGVTAYAGGGQANATQLNNEYNNVTTVATNADSVKLRAATKGLRQVVTNSDSAQNCDVYPQTGDNFLGLAANASTSVAFGTTKEFFCFTDGEWSQI